jgi:hypothetical protein
VVPRQVMIERPSQCFSSNVGVRGCQFLHEGIAEALLQHVLRCSCRSRSVVCYAYVCFELIFAMVCLPRVLVLSQSCFLRSGYLVAGGYVAFFAAAAKSLVDTFFFAAATWSLADTVAFFAVATWLLADGCRALRSGYLVACGWMPCFSTGGCFATMASPTLCWRPLRGCISLDRHSRWAVEVEVPPFVFSCCLFCCCFCIFRISQVILGLLVNPL